MTFNGKLIKVYVEGFLLGEDHLNIKLSGVSSDYNIISEVLNKTELLAICKLITITYIMPY
jgi:hypothetical protein